MRIDTARPTLTRRAAGLAALALTAGSVLGIGVAAPSADANGCSPETGFTACQRFYYTGTDQTFTVPTGVTSISVKLWGAGGGTSWGTGPGGGGFTTGLVAVAPADVLTVTVGQSGGDGSGSAYSAFGGGAPGGAGTRARGGNGGGMSALWPGSSGSNPLLIAGGGGGASGTAPFVGGGGGGPTGAAGSGEQSGTGGTQSAGGSVGSNDCPAAATGGTAYLGGVGALGADGGGGGGGGRYGGGGGACQVDEGGENRDGGGGGGSGYIGGQGVSSAVTSAASGTSSAGGSDPMHQDGIGDAAASGWPPPPPQDDGLAPQGVSAQGLNPATDYGNGQVFIQWSVPTGDAQTITFPAQTAKPWGTDFALTGTSASSGLTPVFTTSSSAAICTVTGTTVHPTGPGDCVIDADQPGNGTYAAATRVSQTITIVRKAQTISFTPPAGAALSAGSVSLTGSATSGLPVTFSSATPLVCTVNGSTVTLGAAGICTIDADQPGNGTYAAAPRTTQTFAITSAAPTSTPAPTNLTSTGAGTAEQSVTPVVPAGGSASLLDADGDPATSVEVEDQGTYTLNNGVITFTPEPGYLGTATPVGFRVSNADGGSGEATYTPTVTIPPPPNAVDKETTGTGTAKQTTGLSIPAFGSITLLDDDGDPVASLTIPGKGTYRLALVAASPLVTFAAVLNPSDQAGQASISFSPVLGYTGIAPPVDFQITDAYGQTDTATYTPTVLLPAPPATGPQATSGAPTTAQQITVVVPAGGSLTLLNANGDPATSVTIAGQGTYTLVGGVITFTPLANFTGTPNPVTYRITDAYGQRTEAAYSPLVTGEVLPVTGHALTNLLAAGLILITAGAALAFAGRRTRRRWGTTG